MTNAYPQDDPRQGQVQPLFVCLDEFADLPTREEIDRLFAMPNPALAGDGFKAVSATEAGILSRNLGLETRPCRRSDPENRDPESDRTP